MNFRKLRRFIIVPIKKRVVEQRGILILQRHPSLPRLFRAVLHGPRESKKRERTAKTSFDPCLIRSVGREAKERSDTLSISFLLRFCTISRIFFCVSIDAANYNCAETRQRSRRALSTRVTVAWIFESIPEADVTRHAILRRPRFNAMNAFPFPVSAPRRRLSGVPWWNAYYVDRYGSIGKRDYRVGKFTRRKIYSTDFVDWKHSDTLKIQVIDLL